MWPSSWMSRGLRSSVQRLHRYVSLEDGSFRRESLAEVRFVPLVEGMAKEG